MCFLRSPHQEQVRTHHPNQPTNQSGKKKLVQLVQSKKKEKRNCFVSGIITWQKRTSWNKEGKAFAPVSKIILPPIGRKMLLDDLVQFSIKFSDTFLGSNSKG
jgi:hypothetical protein